MPPTYPLERKFAEIAPLRQTLRFSNGRLKKFKRLTARFARRQTVVYSRCFIRSSTRFCAPAHRGESPVNIPRLNGIIKVLEQQKHAFVSFAPADTLNAQSYATEPY